MGNGYVTPVLRAHLGEFCWHQRPKILERHIALHRNQCIQTSSNVQPFLSVYLLTYSEQRLIVDSIHCSYNIHTSKMIVPPNQGCMVGADYIGWTFFVNRHPPLRIFKISIFYHIAEVITQFLIYFVHPSLTFAESPEFWHGSNQG